MQRIVSDTGPLLALGILNRLNLLVKLYTTIYVSTEVKEELDRGAAKYPDARNALKAVNKGWLTKTSVDQVFRRRVEELMRGPPKLGKAQAESIALCKQLNIDLLLVDDEDAVKVAQRQGIRTIHGLDILINATKKRLISPSEAIGYINKFRQAGEYGEEDLREAENRIKVLRSDSNHGKG